MVERTIKFLILELNFKNITLFFTIILNISLCVFCIESQEQLADLKTIIELQYSQIEDMEKLMASLKEKSVFLEKKQFFKK